MKKINEIVLFIKNQINVDLKLDDYFTGVQRFNDEIYFNILLEDRVWNTQVTKKLERISGKDQTIKRVEQNGINRLAIFF